MSGTENDGKTGKQEGNDQRQVDKVEIACANAIGRRVHDRRNRAGNGLQLKRDVGNDTDKIDDRHHQADDRIFPVTCGNEVCTGGDALTFGQLHDTPKDRHAKRIHQDRADIDREKFKPSISGKANTAKIGPGRTIDRKAEGIDHWPATWRNAMNAGLPVAITCNGEQKQQIAQGCDDNDPSREHAFSS